MDLLVYILRQMNAIPLILFIMTLPIHAAQVEQEDKFKLPMTLYAELSGGKTADHIEKMKVGASRSGLYRVTSGDQTYILRILDPNRHKQNVTQEIEVSRLMGDMGVAPKVYGSSIEKAAFIMEDIKGSNLFKPTLTKEEIIILGHKLRDIHKQHPNCFEKEETAKDLIKRVIRIDLTFALPEDYQGALAKLEPEFQTLQKNATYTLIHPDLNPGNMLRTNDDIKIIDWESATISNPYLNFAMIHLFFNLDASDLDLLIKSYEADDIKIDRQTLAAASRVVEYLYALNLLGMSYRATSAEKRPVVTHKEKIRTMIKDRKWNELITQFGDPNVTYTASQVLLEDAISKGEIGRIP